GALRTGVCEWHMPIPSTGSARLSAAAERLICGLAARSLPAITGHAASTSL
ncbi:hypothetical protein XVE_2186, partial [Xanthomonas vesicatoria ATCC 35937]